MRPSKNSQSRHAAILARLKENGRATVDELAALFVTTPQTIRKDLSYLADEGLVMRFHGGASLLAGTEYTRFSVRQQIAKDEKETIGRAVAEMVPDNTAVMINSGTTTAAVARHLQGHTGLKIVTDSVSVANEIRDFPGVEVMVPGGVVRASDGAILGEVAVDFIRQFRSDVAVIGAAAIAQDGALLDYDLREASLVRAIVENARHVILAADSSKYDRMASVCIGHLSQVRTLVTDRRCPQELRALCVAHGVGLVEA
ncbi:DeoR/GlpR family DNA-binding transcription regulator [Shimia abyssi]|uniref:DeoR family transcriptional regulator n=1 Tax=Shimia abyssi TaxID=1662395 RepID=A0A2P8F9Q2_9RHOB|nr:DeoR/GlpR family DNA-binding transcription regulator [Shimia abyssi]PSL18451.1 DeoR family transcriptional regulator [Shimia abyssi]